MSTTVTPKTPQGDVIALGVPDSQDYPRLVYCAPYFQVYPLAELIEPSVQESVEGMLPGLVPPYVQDAANTAVQNLAVLLAGSTMSGPLFLNGMPTQNTQAADKQYVDLMVSTSGVPEVPTVPTGQVWGRTTGQWVPIASAEGTFLPLSGGTMQGAINMGGNSLNNLPAVPNLPNGAAPAQWVLNQISASSLYQGTWDVDTYQPDLTQAQYHQNNFSWIAITTSTTGVVVSPPIPGLQGLTIYNGDTIIYSAQAGGLFQAIHAGGLSLSEADARYLQIAGGQMGGSLLLYQDPVANMEAATRQWVLAQIGSGGVSEAPTDGQIYGRNGNVREWMPVVGLGGATLSGPLSLAANAGTAMQAVPLQQLQSTVANYVPLTGNATVTGPITMAGASSNLTLNSNASANLQAVPLQQLTSTLGSYLTASAAASTYLPLTGGRLSASLAISNSAIPADPDYAGLFAPSVFLSPPSVGASVVAYNTYLSSTGGAIWRYLTAGAASYISLGSGGLSFTAFPSGAAGAALGTSTGTVTLNPNGTISTSGTGNSQFTGPILAAGPSTIGQVGFANGVVTGAQAMIGNSSPWASGSIGVMQVANLNGATAAFWTGSSAAGACVQIRVDATFNVLIGFLFGNNGVGNISTDTVGIYFNTNSDDRLKTNVIDLDTSVTGPLVDALQPISYTWTNQPADARLSYGFSAQATEAVFPQAVTPGIGNPGDENFRAYSMDMSRMMPLALTEIKALRARVATLEARVA